MLSNLISKIILTKTQCFTVGDLKISHQRYYVVYVQDTVSFSFQSRFIVIQESSCAEVVNSLATKKKEGKALE